MTKICIFGCKNTTRHIINHVSKLSNISGLVTISPDKGSEQEVAGYDDLSDLSSEIQNIHVAKKYNLNSQYDQDFFESQNFDIGFVSGWQRLVPRSILETFNVGVFGMHGSSQDLPFGRGRSPMNWSLIEGRQWFYTNLFKYMPGVDDGPIVDTSCFSINDTDTAETLHFKNLSAMVSLIQSNWENLANNNLTLKQQVSAIPTVYPKRSPSDSIIDWNDAIVNIERLIRAVAPPFSGAYSFIDNIKLTINRASIFYTDLEAHPFRSLEYGMICDVFPNGKFTIRCNGGVLLAHEYHLEKSFELNGSMKLESPASLFNRFERNEFGFFDIPMK
ncbi:MAG: hypothetical protein COC24_010035 [Alphaproteobacteria bacterium]|nr:hypothetical protein [Alphaproteobacteria bacterium]